MGNNYYKYNGNGFDVIPEPIGGPGFKPEKCGRPSNYRMHQRYGVPMCDACRDAENNRKAYRKAFRDTGTGTRKIGSAGRNKTAPAVLPTLRSEA